MMVTTEMHRVLKLDIYVFIANLSVLSILCIFTILASKTPITLNLHVRQLLLSLQTIEGGGRRDRDLVWKLHFQFPVQSVPITTNVVSSNLVHGDVYSIQHYVMKFVSDLRQVGGFLRFTPPIKVTATICLKYCRKWR